MHRLIDEMIATFKPPCYTVHNELCIEKHFILHENMFALDSSCPNPFRFGPPFGSLWLDLVAPKHLDETNE
jgi:hypothetical protein